MLATPSLLLQTMYQPTDALNKIQLMTSIKILQFQHLYSFVFLCSRRLPEDGIPVPKHVRVW